MNPIFRSLAAGAALALCTALASATVLSFDDLAGADAAVHVPGSYGGLDWSGSAWLAFDGVQAPYTAHSGTGRLTLEFGSTDAMSVIRFTGPTVFDGAWFAGYTEATVRFDLFLGGQRVGSSTTLALTASPAFLASGFSGAIDSVIVSSDLQSFYVMDDFSFHAAAVPEPGTLGLAAAGVACVGFVALGRRRVARNGRPGWGNVGGQWSRERPRARGS